MFSYFNKQEGEDGVYYRHRLESIIEEINNKALDPNEDIWYFEEAINLAALSKMSKSVDQLKSPSVYRISKNADEYEIFIRERFFGGLSPRQFFKNNKNKQKFYKIREEMKKYFKREDKKISKLENKYGYLFPIEDETKEEYITRIVNELNPLLKDEKDGKINEKLIDIKTLINVLYRTLRFNLFYSDLSSLAAELSKKDIEFPYAFLIEYGYSHIVEDSMNLEFDSMIMNLVEIEKKELHYILWDRFTRKYWKDVRKFHFTCDELFDEYDFYGDEYEKLPKRERKLPPKDYNEVVYSFDKVSKPTYLEDLIKLDELSEEAKLWRPIIIDSLRRMKKHEVKDFVNSDDTIIGIAALEKDLILESAAQELIYEDESNKEKLSYIINKKS